MMGQSVSKFFGIGEHRDLPESVLATIRRQQDDSEKLVGVIQLAIIILFSTLFAVAPKPAAMDLMFQPIPWFLGGYFLFTLVRLWLAFQHHLPGWFVCVSVVMDMTLLMGMIWSIHIQYEQPASFYLKVPTLLYVFIFIALRALRFDVRYIVLAGVTAAIGWLLLVGYVFSVDLFEQMVTRDYVAYMTSNKVLVGAEIDKIVSILVVTGILSLAVMRARVLLVQSVREASAAQSLSRFFDLNVAKEIAGSGEALTPGTGVARDAAIVSVDIRGFTPLTQTMSPGELVQFITEYQSRMVPVITPHGGAIDKFLGDGLLVTFGAVKKSATYAADALSAIDSIMAAADAWNAERAQQNLPPVGIGAAAASGSVVCGVIGDAERLEYTVLGDAVNVSAKLESHTKQEKVRALASADIYEQAQTQGYDAKPAHRFLAHRSVGGINTPMDLVVLAE